MRLESWLTLISWLNHRWSEWVRPHRSDWISYSAFHRLEAPVGTHSTFGPNDHSALSSSSIDFASFAFFKAHWKWFQASSSFKVLSHPSSEILQTLMSSEIMSLQRLCSFAPPPTWCFTLQRLHSWSIRGSSNFGLAIPPCSNLALPQRWNQMPQRPLKAF